MNTLQAQIITKGDVIVVQFTGRVDIESAPPFRRACQTRLAGHRIVFDFTGMNFVGSAGMLPFLMAMQELVGRNPQLIKFSGVGTELRRLLSATSLATVEVFDSASAALEAHSRPTFVAAQDVRHASLGAAAFPAESRSLGAEPDLVQNPGSFGLLSLGYEAEDSET